MSTDPYTKVTQLVSRRKFLGAKRIHRLCQREFSPRSSTKFVSTNYLHSMFGSRQSCRINNGGAPTEFIFFHSGTSIIDRHEIIIGAHKWLLSTMSSSSPAAARPWESFREAFRI